MYKEDKIMSKLIPGNHRHLTEEDRNEIEDCLKSGITLRDIAKRVCKDPTTISREIKKHRKEYKTNNKLVNRCANLRDCKRLHACGNIMCRKACRTCNKCMPLCPDYKEYICPKIKRAPYVCNGCFKKHNCNVKKFIYNARQAHNEYLGTLSECREGINSTPEEILVIDEIVKEGVRKGHSIANILHNNQEGITCCERTIYNYIDSGILSVKNIDLRRKVKYKPRNTQKVEKERVLEVHINRTYEDFTNYMNLHDTPVSEMDTVLGCRGSEKSLLTLYSRNTHFMVARLLPNHTQEAVCNEFDTIEELVGIKAFKELYPLVLTDNGAEFLDPDSLEWSKTSEKRTKIFYCNSHSPHEKAGIEKNHEFIRYFVPKKKSFDELNQDDINLMMSHINSYQRESLHMASPYDLMALMYGEDVLNNLGIVHINPADITLTNKIFK